MYQSIKIRNQIAMQVINDLNGISATYLFQFILINLLAILI